MDAELKEVSPETWKGPRPWSIAVPILVPLGFVLWIEAVLATGHANIHGGTAFLFLLATLSGAVVAVWEAVLVPWAVVVLVRRPHLRTPANLAAIGLAVLYLFVAYLAYSEIQHRNSPKSPQHHACVSMSAPCDR